LQIGNSFIAFFDFFFVVDNLFFLFGELIIVGFEFSFEGGQLTEQHFTLVLKILHSLAFADI
jgi:hypothetical protein